MERNEIRSAGNLAAETEKRPNRLSFKAIQEYLICPSCYFGRRVRRELDKPKTRDVLNIGTFLSGVIAGAHTPRKRGLKFESTRAFIGFANFKYADTLLGREKEETEKFLASFSKKQRETINHILASYFEDNKEAKVLGSEKTVEGFLGGCFVWGRIDQLREGKDWEGNKVLEVVEMKFNQELNIQNCFQLGVYTSLLSKDPKIQLPIHQVIYNLLSRRRFTLYPRNSNLILEIVSLVKGAIEAGYDERDSKHVHFPQKRKFGGNEGTKAQFPSWELSTRPSNWNNGKRFHLAAREKLTDYFKNTGWQVENLRKNR